MEQLRYHKHTTSHFSHHTEGESGLVMEEAAVMGGEGKRITMVIKNHGHHPIRLWKGTHLGCLEPVSLVEAEQEPNATCIHTGGLELANEGKDQTEHKPEPHVATLSVEADLQIWFKCLLSTLNLRITHLTDSECSKLLDTLKKNIDVFALDPSELRTTSLVSHDIDTGQSPPIRQGLRRIPFALRKRVDEMIHDMLKQGVITGSRSPWASPIVLVKKKDGDHHFCVDYRRLNQVTKLGVFPLPRANDTLDLLAGTKFFTALDLAYGYWQVPVDPKAREKTAFVTYSGLYEFKKMPFGLVNALAMSYGDCTRRAGYRLLPGIP